MVGLRAVAQSRQRSDSEIRRFSALKPRVSVTARSLENLVWTKKSCGGDYGIWGGRLLWNHHLLFLNPTLKRISPKSRDCPTPAVPAEDWNPTTRLSVQLSAPNKAWTSIPWTVPWTGFSQPWDCSTMPHLCLPRLPVSREREYCWLSLLWLQAGCCR